VRGCGLAALLIEERTGRDWLWAATAAACAGILLLSPTFLRHAAMSHPLPVQGSAIHGYAAAASAIRAEVPPGEGLFVRGNPVPGYLAGARLYLQQASHASTLVPASDRYAAARSGF